MNISRVAVGVTVNTILLAMMTIVMQDQRSFTLVAALAFVFAFFVMVLVTNWVGSEKALKNASHRKVEKVLRELDDDDLDLLRHRLTQDEREEEYGSMAELIQYSKRKKEAS